jgi:hypothetical protein
MIHTSNNPSLTEEEKQIAHMSIVGVSEMLGRIICIRTAEDRAKSYTGKHKQSKKSIARSSAIYSLTLDKNITEPSQPLDIIERLPEDIRNINKSDLRDVLEPFCRMYIIKNTREKIVLPSHRPRCTDYNDDDPGGRPSYYERSPLLELALRTLEKQHVRQFINQSLIKDGILFQFLKYIRIQLFHQIRNAKETLLWNVVKPFPFIDDSIRERPASQVFLNRIRRLSKNDLEREAEILAEKSLNEHKGDVNLFANVIATCLAITGY